MKEKPILVEQSIWQKTWVGLRKRGKGLHEAACIWAGHSLEKEDRVVEVVFLDDLPNVVSFELQHRTSRAATNLLFESLREKRLSIIADIHTHPEGWVDLSYVDRAHPIEFRPGLCALVLPCYASGKPSLSGVGAHVYLGDGVWKMLNKQEMENKIRVK